MEDDMCKCASWNSSLGPLIPCEHINRTDYPHNIVSEATVFSNEGMPMTVCSLLRVMGNKQYQTHHLASSGRGCLSHGDAPGGARNGLHKPDVRMFSSQTLYAKKACEPAQTLVHPALPSYCSREVVFESHRPPSRNREGEEQHDNKVQALEFEAK